MQILHIGWVGWVWGQMRVICHVILTCDGCHVVMYLHVTNMPPRQSGCLSRFWDGVSPWRNVDRGRSTQGTATATEGISLQGGQARAWEIVQLMGPFIAHFALPRMGSGQLSRSSNQAIAHSFSMNVVAYTGVIFCFSA